MNDMIYIEKKSVAPIPKVNGAVSDTWNVENKKTNAPSLDLFERTIIDKLPTLKKVVLWENDDTNSSFTGQNINLITDDYEYIEVIYKQYADQTKSVYCSTGKIPKGNNIMLDISQSYGQGAAYNISICSRLLIYNNSKSYTSENGFRTYNNQGTWTELTHNGACIPVKIYGYRNINYEEELAKDSSTYSTEETIVGTWIDGKTIYRKVINGTIPNSASIVQIALTADTLIKDDISYISSSGFKVNRGHTEEGIVQFDSTLNPNGNLYFSTLSNDAKGKTYTLIVEYTKTTD